MHALADELVDLDRVTSNDIYALLTTYGVEAARKAVIDEVSSVFGAYAIAVDYRHLTIIADYMVSHTHSHLRCVQHLFADPCRRIQALQPDGYLQQVFTPSQSFVRDDSPILVGSCLAW